MPSTKKQIILAVILAVLAIVTVLLLMEFMKGAPANELVFLREGEEYSQPVYQMDDSSLKLKNSEELNLNLVVYIKEKNELQLGFSLPETEESKDQEPFKMELLNTETGETVTEKPIFIRELRDGNCYYRAIFLNAEIDVEASPELELNILTLDNEPLYSGVFINKSTVFTETPLSELPVADDKISLQSSSSDSTGSSDAAA